MAAVYAACMTLIVAAHLGPVGLAVWAAVWSTVVFRTTSSRRTRGGNLTRSQEPSD